MTELIFNTEQINAFQNGEERAFALVRNHFDRGIFTFADHLIQDKLIADEITAEAFVRLWNRCQNFNSVTNIKAFLYITTKNLCLDYLKFRAKEIKDKSEFRYIMQKEEDRNKESELSLIQMQVLAEIYKGIAELPTQQRNVMEGIREGLSTRDIAERLNISTKTVLNLKGLAINALRARCQDLLILLFWLLWW